MDVGGAAPFKSSGYGDEFLSSALAVLVEKTIGEEFADERGDSGSIWAGAGRLKPDVGEKC